MKISVIIPTYWTSSKPTIQHQAPDAVYDHPVPLESQSTLPRLLDSLKNVDLPGELTISIIVAVTHRALEEMAKRKTKEVIDSYTDYLDIKLFSASTLRDLESTDKNLARLLSLYGYSEIRNIGLAIAQILESDIIVFLDDDEVINDKKYFLKAQEHIGKNIDGKLLGGVAGYYTDEHGEYHLNVNPKAWWKLFWPKEKKMNEAFKIIARKHRLSETTFAFGGNMILYWKMFERVPFDPYITRGEDMDLLVNAKRSGFKFMLDTQLKVIHHPGEGKTLWSEMRQDLYRFLYMRQKMLSTKETRHKEIVSIASLEPYPGYFLGAGTCFKFVASSFLNCLHSFLVRNLENFQEFARNIREIRSAFHYVAKHSQKYHSFQSQWAGYLPSIRGKKILKNVLQG
ncbi:MAG: hypothetical protein ACLFU9_02685 [Candidatus Bathyarchaeia archaeon]